MMNKQQDLEVTGRIYNLNKKKQIQTNEMKLMR